MLTNFTEQTMVDALPVGACIFIGPSLLIKAVNEPMLAIWGKDKSVIGKSLYEALPELRNQTVFGEQMNEVYHTGKPFNDPNGQATLLVDGQLQPAYFSYSFKPLYDAEGNIYGIMNIAVDTTSQVLERRLRYEMEERLQFALNAAEIGTWNLNIEQKLVNWDDRCQELHGFAKSDLIDFDEALKHLHPEDRPEIEKAVAYALNLSSGGQFDACFRTINAETGKLRWVHSIGKAYFNGDGKPYRFSGTAQDITAERTQKEKLRQAQEKLQRAFANSAVGMVLTDTDGNLIQVNQTYADMTGYSIKELTGASVNDQLLTHPEDLPVNQALMQKLKRGELPFFDIVKRYIRKNRSVVWIRMNVSSTKDAEGNPDHIIGVALDITAEKLAQQKEQQAYEQLHSANAKLAAGVEELAAVNATLVGVNNLLAFNENKFRAIFEQSPLAIGLLTGEDLVISEANDNALKLWGYTREAVIDKPFRIARPELEGQPFVDYLEETYRAGKTFSYNEKKIYLLRNGRPEAFYLTSVYQPIRNDAGAVMGLLLIMEDVTGRVLSRQVADQAGEQLRLAVESTNLGTWYINAATREFISSPRLKELFGFHADEEMTYEAATAQIPEAYQTKIRAAVEAAIHEYKTYQWEYPIVGFHDQKTRWVKATGKLYPATENKDGFFAGTMQDITEQKQDEQRKNDFISMVSHELKTPLTSMTGYLQLLQAKALHTNDAVTTAMLDKANNQVKKMTTMINGFLNVARLESGKIYIEPQCFDMAVLMKEIEEEVTATFVNHKMVFDPVEETFVMADRDKIGQVVNNFISNAGKYSPPGTTIRIACVTREGQAQVSVTDEGMGVSPKDKDKLFDRFYRAQHSQISTIAGFGIGLYICSEIIQRHNGQIGLESESGKGSTFYFTLPVNG